MFNISKEIRCIKFHLDKSVNKAKKDKLFDFLTECNYVQNQLFDYYWKDENFKIIIDSNNKIDFNYKSKLKYRDFTPILKSHHFQQVSQQVFANLKSIQSNIINKIGFKFDDKEKQGIYNYMKGFCFDWNYLEKYIPKQLGKYKKDEYYCKFLQGILDIIENEDKYNKIKSDIECEFWNIKSRYKIPNKKEFQLLCNSSHTVDCELKEFQWIFTLDTNERIGGSDKKGVYNKLVIPVKYSKYHKKILADKKLSNTFNFKMNRNGNIEIIATYETEIVYPQNKIKQEVGIDIGLKKLIVSSDGEIVEQNSKIVLRLNSLNSKRDNRKRLESHLKTIYSDDEFKLSNKRYLKQEYNFTSFVRCDNRYKIKQFLSGREHFNIVMEDLDISQSRTYNGKVNNQIRRMMIQQIKNDIAKYSKINGNVVTSINPAYTSQQCSKCGCVDKDNRKTQEMFCCVKCNHTLNADYNASINVLGRAYDERITLKMKPREVLKILTN